MELENIFVRCCILSGQTSFWAMAWDIGLHNMKEDERKLGVRNEATGKLWSKTRMKMTMFAFEINKKGFLHVSELFKKVWDRFLKNPSLLTVRCDYIIVTHCTIVNCIIWGISILKIHDFRLSKITWDGPTDRRTDGPTDGPTDGRTRPLIEMRSRI